MVKACVVSERHVKAIVCVRPLELALVSRPDPVRRPDEVLVRIRCVGLCGTDYHIYEGNQPFLNYPRIMGPELSGEVAAAPADSGVRPGQIVAINPYLSGGRCRACRRGRPNCCSHIQVLGVHRDGGMSDYLCVPPHAVVDATGLTLEQAAMVEFLAIGAHAVSRSGACSGDRVLVGVAKGDLVFAGPEFHKRETTLLASPNALKEDFDRVIAAMKAGRIPDPALYTHGFDAVDMPTRLPRLIVEADQVLKAIARF